MRLEDVDVLETKTNGAPTEERIQFIADIDYARGKLITAEIKRANDERVRLHLLGHFSIRFVLFLFARERVAIHKKKFSAIEPDPFSAVFGNRFHVAWQFDIRRENNVAAVARSR